MTVQLRPYQQRVQAEVFDHWRSGARNVLCVMPCGAGKTHTFSDTVRQFAQNGQSSLLLAHRREINSQISLTLGQHGVHHRLIAPKNVIASISAEHRRKFNGKSFINPSATTAVGSVDTVISRMDTLKPWLRSLDLLVADEAHHVSYAGSHTFENANKWAKVFETCNRALGLGVTATPLRGDGRGLGRHTDGVFDKMVLGPDMRWLINEKQLCDYDIIVPESHFDMSKLKEGEEDYTRASLKEAADSSPKLVGDIVETYCKHVYGKRAICFATDVGTSSKIAAQFNAVGIPAASVSAETDSSVRDDVMRRLRDGRLWVVINVDLYGEGTDVPDLDVVIMARPTASLNLYIQQFCRCLRTAIGKVIGTVIDHVGNILRFGFPDKSRAWSLERVQKRAKKEKDPEEVAIAICVETGRPYLVTEQANCPHCGQSHVKPSGATGTTREIQQVAGDLTRLSAADLAILRQAMQLPDPNTAINPNWSGGVQAGQRNILYAHHQAQRELVETVELWAGMQRHKYGRSDSEIHRRWYSAVGMDMITATGAATSRTDMIALKARVEEWLNG